MHYVNLRKCKEYNKTAIKFFKMKKVILSIVMIATVSFTSCKSDTKKEGESEVKIVAATTEASFGVRGNCGMCKTTIEKAANGVEGVNSANWDKTKKKITVSFESLKTNLDAIHEAIANSGYDTDKNVGNEEAYKELPSCCQYDHSMEMSITGDVKDDEHDDH
jgi:copper chaperone CopZ